MLNKAIEIAVRAHEGQFDKAGEPYILHPLRVMLTCELEAERICAVLHDVIEDTHVTYEFLRSQGFSDEVIEALECLAKNEGEDYEAFIDRVLKNKLACRVKLADLQDNMNISRLKNPTEADIKRIEKYRGAVKKILETINFDAEPVNLTHSNR